MQVFKVGDAADRFYKGSGHAVAAVKNGEVVDLIYIQDFIKEFNVDENGKPNMPLPAVVADPRLIVPVNSLIPQGKIFYGIAGAREFVVL